MSVPGRPIRILVMAPEPVSNLVTGPNLRAAAFARQLGLSFDATLAVSNETGVFQGEPFRTRFGSRKTVLKWLAQYDVVVSQGAQYPARGIARADRRRPIQVFDLNEPLLFEALSGKAGAAPEAPDQTNHLRRLTALILQRGDFFLCSSPQQRDLWTGALYVLGRFGRRPIRQRPEDYIGVVPFGHTGETPAATRPALKGVHPGIGRGDKVILWGGGVWNWLDPLTLIRAMKALEAERPEIKLFFMAIRYPDKEFRAYEMAEKAQALARDLNLLGRTVFFHEDWVPFEERANYLLDADLAVCTAPEGLENLFSFRTRLVDAVWAGTPIVCTRGGFMADFVEKNGIGLTVSGQNVEELKEKIVAALASEAQAQFRTRVAACRDALRWDRCLRPLVEFCQKVQRGEFHRPPEPFWTPWFQYLAYKVPALLSSLRRS